MKKIDLIKANDLLDNLVISRKKFNSNKSQKNLLEYTRLLNLCTETFDFLVKSRTKRYKSYSNYEDLVQDGRIALMLSLKTYDGEKGNFYVWAKQYINTKISREANRHSTIKIPIEKTIDYKPKKVGMPIMTDDSPNAFDNLYSSEMKQIISSAISKLPKEQQKIVELNNNKCYSINKISKELKISEGNCIKLLKQAHKSLKFNLVEHKR